MDVIIDAYNVIFKVPELGSNTKKCDIEVLRNRFLSILSQYKAKRKHKLIVVFDGKGSGTINQTEAPGIDVVFSRQGLNADKEIKRMVSNSNRPREITVVTSDRDIMRFVERCGSKVMEPLEFYRDVTKKIVRQTENRRGRKNIMRDDGEPMSKYTGPTKSEVQHWLKVFSNKTGKGSND